MKADFVGWLYNILGTGGEEGFEKRYIFRAGIWHHMKKTLKQLEGLWRHTTKWRQASGASQNELSFDR